MDVPRTFPVILRKEAVSAASVHPRHMDEAGEQGRKWSWALCGEAACRWVEEWVERLGTREMG